MQGMSVSKFTRILRILASDFFLYSELFFVHKVDLTLNRHRDLRAKIDNELAVCLEENIYRYLGKDKQLKELMTYYGAPTLSNAEYIPYIVKEVKAFSKAKRRWLKAFDVFLEIMVLAKEEVITT